MTPTAVFAHRGACDAATENTVAAFVEARRLGADGVELDVRRSADGALVVHHDAVVEGGGRICDLAVADLPPHVPLLAEALAACEPLQVNVEIKNSPGDPGYEADGAIAADVAATVAELGTARRVVVSSFDRATLDALRAADPGLRRGWLLPVGADVAAALPTAAAAGDAAVHPFVTDVTAEVVAAAHRAGLAVATWTVNHPDDLRRMVRLGVDTVITDRLAEALAVVRAP